MDNKSKNEIVVVRYCSVHSQTIVSIVIVHFTQRVLPRRMREASAKRYRTFSLGFDESTGAIDAFHLSHDTWFAPKMLNVLIIKKKYFNTLNYTFCKFIFLINLLRRKKVIIFFKEYNNVSKISLINEILIQIKDDKYHFTFFYQ